MTLGLRRRAPLVAAVLFAVLLLACQGRGERDEPVGGSPSPASDASSPLSVEDVYRRFADAITRPGQVYHGVIEIERPGGLFAYSGTSEYWVDAERDVARQESEITQAGRTFRTQTVIAGGALYRSGSEDQPPGKVEASQCHGANAAVSSVLGCPGPTEESVKAVEMARYQDRDTIVLVTSGVSRGSDETFTFTSRLFLDEETLLPIASETEGTLERRGGAREHSVALSERLRSGGVPTAGVL